MMKYKGFILSCVPTNAATGFIQDISKEQASTNPRKLTDFFTFISAFTAEKVVWTPIK
jgi:hypothetical protein